MTRTFVIGLLAICMTSCMESFESIDPTEFNNLIAGRAEIETAEELILIYYNYPDGEGIPNLTIAKRDLGDNKIELTLIHDGQEDDSQRALKIVMTVMQTGQTWAVLEIKKNRKCWDGRGHTNWGKKWCS